MKISRFGKLLSSKSQPGGPGLAGLAVPTWPGWPHLAQLALAGFPEPKTIEKPVFFEAFGLQMLKKTLVFEDSRLKMLKNRRFSLLFSIVRHRPELDPHPQGKAY